MKKQNNKQNLWFFGIITLLAIGVITILCYLAFYEKTNLGENFVTFNTNNAKAPSDDKTDDEPYFLLKNDKNGETIVAIGNPTEQYLDNTNINLVSANEIIAYGENNSQLIYTFFDQEQYENCQKQNNSAGECPTIRKFISYDTETGERKTILEKDYSKAKKYVKNNSTYSFESMQIVGDYLYILESPAPMGWGLVAPNEIVFRIDLKNPQSYEYLNNEEVIGWMKTYQNKIYFVYSYGDEGGPYIRNFSSYNPESNSVKTLWEEDDDTPILDEGFFYNNEYIITPYDANGKMLVYGINLETGKRRLISESKEKFPYEDNEASKPLSSSKFDGYSKIIFTYGYGKDVNKIYFYDLEKDDWNSIGNLEIRYESMLEYKSEKFVYETLINNGFDYNDNNIHKLYSLYYSEDAATQHDFFEELYLDLSQ